MDFSTRLLRWAFVAATLMMTGPVFAEDHCGDIFLQQLANITVQSSDQNSALAVQNARCARNGSAASSNSRTGLGASYNVFNFDYAQKNGSSESTSSSDCGSESSDQHFSAALYYAQTQHSDVVNAWETCMLNKHQFVCTPQNQNDPSNLQIDANWGILSPPPKVVTSRISKGNEPGTDAWPKGTQLLLGHNLLFIHRQPNQSVSVGIEASSDNTSGQSCAVWIPPAGVEKGGETTPPSTIEASWSSRPAIAVLPPPGGCACVSFTRSVVPNFSIWPHAPYKNGVTDTITNDCATAVSAFAMNDTVVRALGVPPMTPAQGRSFSYETLQPGQRLILDLSGSIGGFLTFNSCPASAFVPPPPGSLHTQKPLSLCVSNKRIDPQESPVSRVCPAQGEPGTDCTCNGYPGVNWIGPLPPP